MSPERVSDASRASSAVIATVLVVDDDPGTLDTVGRLLRLSGIHVHEASSGAEAIAVARAHRLGLALIDWRLPDMTGFDVAETFRHEGLAIPWILTSAFLDFDVALEAGRRGALHAVSSAFDAEEMILQVLASEMGRRPAGWPRLPIGARIREPKSTAGRGAWWMLRACDSIDDLSTLDEWRLFVAISYSQLRDAYYRLDIPPHDARDFMRVLRALMRTDGRVDHVEAELTVGDYRTSRELLDRAGLGGRDRLQLVSFEDFLLAQRFIKINHPVLQALRTLVVGL